mmetsp:Transcript_8884/g.13981  ORF Transcript_8884/g.13981 Transcript_8884/m.13981 type:complete len:91 (-) Transcript_8884:974-1246(-)
MSRCHYYSMTDSRTLRLLPSPIEERPISQPRLLLCTVSPKLKQALRICVPLSFAYFHQLRHAWLVAVWLGMLGLVFSWGFARFGALRKGV